MRRGLSILGLVAFLFAVPGLLVQTAGPPTLPAAIDLDDLRRTLSGPFLSVELVLRGLAILAWGLWVYLTLVLFLRMVAVARLQRRPGGGDKLLRATSRLAPAVVLTLMDLVIAMILVVGPSPSKALARTEAVATSSPVQVATNGSARHVVMERSYVVRPGDSLWRIAKRELGAGERWREIFDLNTGRSFPDGRVLRKPDVIRPNWVLRIPVETPPPVEPTPESPPLAAPPTASVASVEPETPTPPSFPEQVDPAVSSNGSGGPPAPAISAPGPSPSSTKSASPTPSRTEPSPPPVTPSVRSQKPVVHLPSGAALAASFAAGVLAAQALATLRWRRKYRPAFDGAAEQTMEPDLVVGLRKAQAIDGAKLLAGTAELISFWRNQFSKLPKMLAAIEQEDKVAFLLDEDEDAPPSNGRKVLSRAGNVLRVEIRGPFVPPDEPLSAIEAGGIAALGAVDQSTVHLGLLGLGAVGITGSRASRFVEQTLLGAATTHGPDQLDVFVIGDLEELDRCLRIPHVRAAAPWSDCDSLIRELQIELLARARAMLERSAAGIWEYAGCEESAPIPATLVVVSNPPEAMRAVMEGFVAQGSKLGFSLLAVGWKPATAAVNVEIEDVIKLETSVPLPKKAVRALLLEEKELDEALEIVRQAYPTSSGPSPEEDERVIDLDPLESTPAVTDDSTSDQESAELSAGHPIFRVEDVPSEEPPISEDAAIVRALGPFDVSRRGRVVQKGWRSSSKELLAYLIAYPKGASKETLVSVLWPEVSDHRKADRMLRDAIYRLRMIVVDPAEKWTESYVVRNDSWISLEADRWMVDAWRFESLVKRRHRTQPETLLASLREAVGMYRGEFFEGSDFSWVEGVREHYRQLFITASLSLAEVLRLAGDAEEAVGVVDDALRVSPLCEELHRKAMELDALAGRPQSAEKRYQKLVLLLADQLGEEPEPETKAVRQQIRSSLSRN